MTLWLPSNAPGAYSWFKAKSSADYTVAGGALTALADKSGKNHPIGLLPPAANGAEQDGATNAFPTTTTAAVASDFSQIGVSVSNAATVGPSGATDAVLVTEDTSTARHIIYISGYPTSNKIRTWMTYAKAHGRRYFVMDADGCQTVFDLNTGLVTDHLISATQSGWSAKAEAAAYGFWKLTVQVYDTVASSGYWVYCLSDRPLLAGSQSFSEPSYTGDGVSGVYVWRPKLVISTPSALPTVSATGLDGTNPAFVFDGSNGQSLPTAISSNMQRVAYCVFGNFASGYMAIFGCENQTDQYSVGIDGSNHAFLDLYGDTNIASGGAVARSTPQMIVLIRDAPNSLYEVRVNGVSVAKGSYSHGPGADGFNHILGGVYNRDYTTGAIGEGFVLQNCDPVTIQQWEGYCAWDWGYQATLLPTGHMFKSAAPTVLSGAVMPAGAQGIWYAKDYDSAKKAIPNFASGTLPSLLDVVSRVNLDGQELQAQHPDIDQGNGAMAEVTTTGPLGNTIKATRFYSAGDYYFFFPYGISGPLTMEFDYISNTGASQTFACGDYNHQGTAGAWVTKTATASWQRGSVTMTDAVNLWPMICMSPDRSTGADILMANIQLSKGSSALGRQANNSPLLFDRIGVNNTTNPATGVLDLSANGAALFQVSPPVVITDTGFTVGAMVRRVASAAPGFCSILSSCNNWTDFSAFIDYQGLSVAGVMNNATAQNFGAWDVNNDGWHSVIHRFDGTYYDIFFDDARVLHKPLSPSVSITVRNFLVGSIVGLGTYSSSHQFNSVFCYFAPLPVEQIQSNIYPALAARVVGDGQAHTHGAVLIGEGDELTTYASSYYYQAASLMVNAQGVTFAVATSDISYLKQRLDNTYDSGGIPPLSGVGTHIYSGLFGKNGLESYSGATDTIAANNFLAEMLSGYDMVRARGLKALACTVLPRNNATHNARRAIVNAGLRAAVGTRIDAVCDFDTDAQMGIDAAYTTYVANWTDGDTPNATGHARLAPIYAAAVNTLLPAAPSGSTYNDTRAEAVTLTEGPAGVYSVTTARTETAAPTDAPVAAGGPLTLTEAVAPTDSGAAGGQLVAARTDAAAPTDAPSAGLLQVAAEAETIAPTESIGRAGSSLVTTAETTFVGEQASGLTQKQYVLTTGSSWSVPGDFNTSANTIEMIDGGGAFGDPGSGTYKGGDGGQYRRYVNVALTPGGTAAYTIGNGGFSSYQLGGATGMTGCTSPAVTNNGGAGASDANNFAVGWGGGAGGPGGTGGLATGSSAGAGGAGAWGAYAPGAGGAYFSGSGNGNLYGGGGGGDSGSGINGAGAQGIIIVTYTPKPPTLADRSETAAIAESSATLATANLTQAETAASVEASTGSNATARTVAETATATEAAANLAAAGAAQAETATVTEQETSIQAASRAVSETSTGTDAQAGGLAMPAQAAELAAGGESPVAATILPAAASETATGLETVAAVATMTRAASEAAAPTESIASLAASNITRAEPIVADETSTPGSANLLTQAETIAPAESSAQALASVAARAELAALGDAETGLAAMGAQASESAVQTDAPASGSTAPVTASEAAQQTDGLTGGILQTSTRSEAVVVTDAQAFLFIVAGFVSDQTAALDASVSINTMAATLAESGVLVDLEIAGLSIPLGAADGIGLLDLTAQGLFLPAVRGETATATEVSLTDFLIARGLTEAASPVDLVSVARVLAGDAAETATAFETLDAVRIRLTIPMSTHPVQLVGGSLVARLTGGPLSKPQMIGF